MTTALFAFAVLLAYLLGSVPFGLMLAFLYEDQDLREVGSGNIGATNVLRTTTRGLGALTLALDLGKGAVPTALAWYGLGVPWMAAAVGLAAVIGHCWPVYLEFRGGKGVATATGVLVVLAPYATLAAALVWIGVFAAFRRSSLAALVAVVVLQGLIWGLSGQWLWLSAVLAGILVQRHVPNIKRLVSGTEGKVG